MGEAIKKPADFGKLTVVGTNQQIIVFPGLKVGRGDESDLKLNDPKVSRVHIVFDLDEDGVLVLKESSRNGTTVDGKLVAGDKNLYGDCQIRLGDTCLQYVCVSATTATKSEYKRKPKLNVMPDHKENYLEYPRAHSVKRLIALLIDSTIYSIIMVSALSIFFSGITSKDSPFMLVSFVITMLYYYLSMKKTGQSPGKKIMKIKVIRLDGKEEFSLWKIFLREYLGKIVVPFSLFVMLTNTNRRTIHDYLAGTRVVEIE